MTNNFLKKKTTVRLGELKFSCSNDGIWGDKKPITIDRDNVITDGNHRIYKLLSEEGPNHEIEIDKWIVPQWAVILGMAVVAIIKWAIFKAKALYTKDG
jgi:hypothetical protein